MWLILTLLGLLLFYEIMEKGTYFFILFVVLGVLGAIFILFQSLTNNWILDFIIFLVGIEILSSIFKTDLKASENIKDLKTYGSIDDVIKKYGVPDDIQKLDIFTKYTFKKATKLFNLKYKVDIFTLQNGQLIKHESFYE